MDLSFANPVGFWALLGVPAVLAIHLLQRQSRRYTVSTLFLLEQLPRESTQGRKLERLRNSLPLWLQLLIVLLLTWILAEPRWLRTDRVQRIAIVTDSSASMVAFRERLAPELRRALAPFTRSSATTEYVVLPSHAAAEPLYSGTSLTELETRMETWRPRQGAHDPGPALRVARSLVGGDGLVVLLTDHPREGLPYGAQLLAVGEPVSNVGFVGLTVLAPGEGLEQGGPADSYRWRALVRNHSDSVQTRQWQALSERAKSPARGLTLEPGQTLTLEGGFPNETERLTLRLEGDAFFLDDQLPLLKTATKRLTIAVSVSAKLEEDAAAILDSFPDLVAQDPTDETPPDVVVSGYDPLSPSLAPGSGIVYLEGPPGSRPYLKGPVVAENHPLVEGLNWQGLLARSAPGLPLRESDTVLLWQGERPIIVLQRLEGSRRLVFNFDFAASNATRLPAYIVLLHRYLEGIRAEKVAEERRNLECGQPLMIAHHRGPEAGELELEQLALPQADRGSEPVTEFERYRLDQLSLLTAPADPGFLEIRQKGESLLQAAAHFADPREGDFSQAGSGNDLPAAFEASLEQQRERDDFWQLWLLLALGILLASWLWIDRSERRRRGEGSVAPPLPSSTA